MPPRKRKEESSVAATKTDSVDLSNSEDTEFYNIHEGNRGRQPGEYLDVVERMQAEFRRADVEDREPDFDNPPATAGTPLVTKAILDTVVNPSSVGNTDDQLVAPEPVSTLPVDLSDGAAEVNVTGGEGEIPAAETTSTEREEVTL